MKGVANCKVLDETDNKKCKECMSEYYINGKQECISNMKKLFK